MSIIGSGFGSSAGTSLGNSVRLRSAASAYLGRVFGTPTDNRKWTWSGWVKRGSLGVAGHLFSWYSSSEANNYFYFSGDVLNYTYDNGTTYAINTSAVFRDPTAWYHIMLVVDTVQAAASDRTKIYVNGVEQTVTGSHAPQNSFPYINSATRAPTIGRRSAAADQYFDGYIHSVCFVDGEALTPGSFATLDAETSQWTPKSAEACKAVVDAGGSNSFMLAFDDGTSLTTLGYDYSSKGNDWTGVNISLTAGITYDWVVDAPTTNYSTLTPLQPLAGSGPSNGNLTASGTGASVASSLRIPPTGKWYAEYIFTTINTAAKVVVLWNTEGTNNVGYRTDGFKLVNSAYTSYGSSWGVNVTIGVAVDADAGQITFYRNGVAQPTLSYQFSNSDWYLATGNNGTNGNDVYHMNFGQRPWTYAPPTGFVGLATHNLPQPTIKNPKTQFDVKLWVGTSLARTISGYQFSPDLTWIKQRSGGDGSSGHVITDVIRGATKELYTNLTNAEATSVEGVTAFTSDGYSLGTANNVNQTGANLVGFAWNVVGTSSSNTNGTITSQVAANTTAGVSIVTYTGTGLAGTVGHGLSVAPAMIIAKDRTAARTSDQWPTYHKSIGASGTLVYLNSSGAGIASSIVWNNTNPTSSVFSVGTWGGVNFSGDSFVAYCFAEVPGFSKVGSYTNNSSTNGPFIYCGFKPAFVMIKYISAGTSDWMIFDSTRDPTNVVSPYIRANLNANEATVDWVDFVATGFKIRNTGATSASINFTTGTGTFVFIAFAESPTKYANAR